MTTSLITPRIQSLARVMGLKKYTVHCCLGAVCLGLACSAGAQNTPMALPTVSVMALEPLARGVTASSVPPSATPSVSLSVPPSAPLSVPPLEQAISLNFQNIELTALLQIFADYSGLNVVPTEGVAGLISVRLNQVPWQQALNIVLQSKGLVSRQEGRVLWVAPQGEWALREKKSLENQAALESVMPLQMLSMRLQYARATEVAQRLQGGTAGSTGGRWLSGRGSVLAEPRTNQLFISDLSLIHI